MTSQKAKEIVEYMRGRINPVSDGYMAFLSNTISAFTDDNKPITKESLEIVLRGFAISNILGYMCDFDLEAETNTFLTNDLIEDVLNFIWDDWLKEQVEKIEGDNVVQLKAIN